MEKKKEENKKTSESTPSKPEAKVSAGVGHPTTPSVKADKKGREIIPGQCLVLGCKVKSNRMDFCHDHYEAFKFGLYNKLGESVSDFEKKMTHFQKYKHKKGLHKAA